MDDGQAIETVDAVELPPGQVRVGGDVYMRDAKGALVPVGLVKAKDRLVDEMVRKVMGYALPLAAQVGRFRQHTFDDVDGLMALLAQEHGAKDRGRGNVKFTSYDGLLQVQVAIADRIEFGPELQVAKSLVDECLREWSADGRDELKVVVEGAFGVDKQGQVDRAQLFGLLRHDIADPRWQRGMNAIRESMRVVGSKRYVRVYRRSSAEAGWEHVAIDMAAA